MSAFVLDCSVSSSWLLKGQSSEETDMLLERVKAHGAVVPSIWISEISNVLVSAVRREKLTKSAAIEQLSLLKKLPITIHQDSESRSYKEVFLLAIEHGLTSYDATYLDLAVMKGIPIATRDKSLKRVAECLGVENLL